MSRTKLDVTSLIWGLLFFCAASLGLWIGLGNPVSWEIVKILAPIILVGLGALGLILGRSKART